jgi:hypothetical protein
MFSLFVGYVIAKSDRRLDPFQFNVCSWNLDGFDEAGHNTAQEEEISRIIYSYLSTCDTLVLPGITKEESIKNILSIMESKGMEGFVNYSSDSAKRSVTLYSRLDFNGKTDMPNKVAYPIENSSCSDKTSGEFDFSGSFYGEVEFHDPVNKTNIFVVDFPTAKEGTCAVREALAAQICKVVNEQIPKDHDVVISGTFGAPSSDDEKYEKVLEGCGFKKGSSTTKKSVSNKDGKLVEDAYVRGGASKWLDVFESVVVDKIFPEQKVITYPTILYIHQPLSSRWFKFEISFSTVMMAVAIAFFTWLMFFSREKKEDEGEYEKIPGN